MLKWNSSDLNMDLKCSCIEDQLRPNFCVNSRVKKKKNPKLMPSQTQTCDHPLVSSACVNCER